MAIKLVCDELGVVDCDFVAQGEAPGDVVEELVAHLREAHDLDMPDADEILEDDFQDEVAADLDPAVLTVVKRLREELDLNPIKGPLDASASIGKLT